MKYVGARLPCLLSHNKEKNRLIKSPLPFEVFYFSWLSSQGGDNKRQSLFRFPSSSLYSYDFNPEESGLVVDLLNILSLPLQSKDEEKSKLVITVRGEEDVLSYP